MIQVFETVEQVLQSGNRYRTIYADPPWLYGNQATRAATSNHYDGVQRIRY